MCKQPRTTRRIAAPSWNHAERMNTVKLLFARPQLIDGRRRRAGVGHGRMFRIVPQIAHSGVRLETQSVRQVNSVRRDVVNSGETVVAKRRQVGRPAKQAAVRRFRAPPSFSLPKFCAIGGLQINFIFAGRTPFWLGIRKSNHPTTAIRFHAIVCNRRSPRLSRKLTLTVKLLLALLCSEKRPRRVSMRIGL
jgi:hypothetical protein